MGLLGNLSPLSALDTTARVYVGGGLCEGYTGGAPLSITWNECWAASPVGFPCSDKWITGWGNQAPWLEWACTAQR